eukprot:PhM_4_TR13698/c1_g2_i1/m.22926/K13093/HTATSF1; HIV Tat-specific factor 1
MSSSSLLGVWAVNSSENNNNNHNSSSECSTYSPDDLADMILDNKITATTLVAPVVAQFDTSDHDNHNHNEMKWAPLESWHDLWAYLLPSVCDAQMMLMAELDENNNNNNNNTENTDGDNNDGEQQQQQQQLSETTRPSDQTKPTKKTNTKKKGNETEAPSSSWFELKVNTNVYVTGLPPDATVDELDAFFSKAGAIRVDRRGQKKIKIYGKGKGDGLVCFVRVESVATACENLDGMPLRRGFELKVEPAVFEQRGEQYVAPDKSQMRASNKALARAALAVTESDEGAVASSSSYRGGGDGDVTGRIVLFPKALQCDDNDKGGFMTRKAQREVEERVVRSCESHGVVDNVKIYRKTKILSVLMQTKEGAEEVVHYLAKAGVPCEIYDGSQSLKEPVAPSTTTTTTTE